MSFFSIGFIIFFVFTFIIYNSVTCNYRHIVLLVASYIFYALFDFKYVLVLFGVTLLSFILGKKISILKGNGESTESRLLLGLGIVLILLTLVFFKFGNYFYLSVHRLFGKENIIEAGAAALIAPIGISFFSLEAIGYMVDIYRGTALPEENFLKYALFISFFPKIISGPIERSTNLLKQIHDGIKFEYEKVKTGFFYILWGSFIKLLIANRLSVIVDAAFSEYQEQTGFTLLIAVVIYGVQLYVDFSGYSYIAIGMAGVFGYDLTENFIQPYFAGNVREFWKRWHVSLSNWLRDYVYIPLGGSRCGKVRRYFNLIITFLVSGIWHGVGMHFVAWGLLHGIYQIFSVTINSLNVKNEKEKIIFCRRLIKAFGTFVLIDFAWLFFRAESVGSAIEILSKIIFYPEIGRTIFEGLCLAGVEVKKVGLLIFELLLLLLVDICHEKNIRVLKWLDTQDKWFRWGIYVVMSLFIVIGMIRDYGADASTFIYANF